MSNYRNSLSREKIQRFISEKRKFDINISTTIGRAWKDATSDVGNTFLIGLVFIFLGFLAPWLLAGLFIGKYEERVEGKRFEINSLFKGFDHGGPIFMYLILNILFTIGFLIIGLIPIGILVAMAEYSGIFALLAFLAYLVLILALIIGSLLTFFSLQFIVFARMEPMEAMKASAGIIRNNLLTVFLFGFVSGIVAELGIFLCCIGFFFTLPVAYFAYYYAFQDVFQIEGDDDNTDEIIDHLV